MRLFQLESCFERGGHLLIVAGVPKDKNIFTWFLRGEMAWNREKNTGLSLTR